MFLFIVALFGHFLESFTLAKVDLGRSSVERVGDEVRFAVNVFWLFEFLFFCWRHDFSSVSSMRSL